MVCINRTGRLCSLCCSARGLDPLLKAPPVPTPWNAYVAAAVVREACTTSRVVCTIRETLKQCSQSVIACVSRDRTPFRLNRPGQPRLMLIEALPLCVAQVPPAGSVVYTDFCVPKYYFHILSLLQSEGRELSFAGLVCIICARRLCSH